MKLYGLKNCDTCRKVQIVFAIAASLLLMSCASKTTMNATSPPPARPPNPELNLGAWAEPLERPQIVYEETNKVMATHMCPPMFPESALENGVCRGEVLLRFDVSNEGAPINIRIAQPSAHASFERLSVEAVRKCWRFAPHTADEPAELRKGLSTTITFNACEE